MIQTLLDFDLRVMAPELTIVAATALLMIVDLLYGFENFICVNLFSHDLAFLGLFFL